MSSPSNNDGLHQPLFTAIIQARMGSSRLPGKAMLDLAGKPLLAHVIERTKAISGVHSVVLATGSLAENKPLIDLALSMNILTFSGSDENVLERYYMAAEEFGGDFIVRVTGDNPFMDPDYATQTIQMARKNAPDLCSISNLPLGVAVEIIKRDALIISFTKSRHPHQFEHVTPYIKENNDRFLIKHETVELRNPFPSLRLTVDEENDFRLAGLIYNNLYRGSIIPLNAIIDYLIRNPQLVAINSLVRQKTMNE